MKLQIAKGTIAGSSVIGRRYFMRQVAVVGLTAGAVTFPALAQQAVEQVASSAGSGQNFLDRRLARYAADLKYEDLPEDVVRIVKRSILDTVGCAIGGYSAGPSKIAIKLASDVSSKPERHRLVPGYQNESRPRRFR